MQREIISKWKTKQHHYSTYHQLVYTVILHCCIPWHLPRSKMPPLLKLLSFPNKTFRDLRCPSPLNLQRWHYTSVKFQIIAKPVCVMPLTCVWRRLKIFSCRMLPALWKQKREVHSKKRVRWGTSRRSWEFHSDWSEIYSKWRDMGYYGTLWTEISLKYELPLPSKHSFWNFFS